MASASGAGSATAAVGGLKKVSALHARNMAWLGWARETLGLPAGPALAWEADALNAAAEGLAACRPYVVPLADVSIEVGCLPSHPF